MYLEEATNTCTWLTDDSLTTWGRVKQNDSLITLQGGRGPEVSTEVLLHPIHSLDWKELWYRARRGQLSSAGGGGECIQCFSRCLKTKMKDTLIYSPGPQNRSIQTHTMTPPPPPPPPSHPAFLPPSVVCCVPVSATSSFVYFVCWNILSSSFHFLNTEAVHIRRDDITYHILICIYNVEAVKWLC